MLGFKKKKKKKALALTGVAHLVGHHLGIILQSQRSRVRFLVTAQAWVAGSDPSQGTHERQPINVSLPLFLPPLPSL